ncbi:hypothetical protein K7W42_13025 [Deinococcus sp. HMF7604]|uniref:hypothetical protein n=1 Tax=Deinococcus betulae TaxID=2873312 RepID=UPI001CCEEA30|nr:hypothetical protein [Deinococcus betulae]MBZ9751780.1 hypothetical protein [Deinococcus betulae]
MRANSRLPGPSAALRARAWDGYTCQAPFTALHPQRDDGVVAALTTEPIELNLTRAVRRLHALSPGLAAWTLQELHAAFSLTCLLATPQWAAALIPVLYRQSPQGRRTLFRIRHPEHRRARARFTEVAIHHEGYVTTASPRLSWGRWLTDSPWPVRDPLPCAVLAYQWPDLAAALREALADRPPEGVTPITAPYPALHLQYWPGDGEDAPTLTNELLEHLTQTWRHHDGTFAVLNTRHAGRARAYQRVWRRHQTLVGDVVRLLRSP